MNPHDRDYRSHGRQRVLMPTQRWRIVKVCGKWTSVMVNRDTVIWV
jgi:hypothetical protein